MNGKGVFEWPDGRKYEGEFVDDHREGQGIHVWPDGSKYEGGWLKGKYHGFGIFTKANGKQTEADFDKGKKIKEYVIREETSLITSYSGGGQ